jgi:hypothetical protein
MMYATRDGKFYRRGDPGFEEAWSATMREVDDETRRDWTARHNARLASDPEYAAEWKRRDDEYERLFAPHSTAVEGDGMSEEDDSVEISPEVLLAGYLAWDQSKGSLEDEALVARIYTAMVAEERRLDRRQLSAQRLPIPPE